MSNVGQYLLFLCQSSVLFPHLTDQDLAKCFWHLDFIMAAKVANALLNFSVDYCNSPSKSVKQTSDQLTSAGQKAICPTMAANVSPIYVYIYVLILGHAGLLDLEFETSAEWGHPGSTYVHLHVKQGKLPG